MQAVSQFDGLLLETIKVFTNKDLFDHIVNYNLYIKTQHNVSIICAVTLIKIEYIIFLNLVKR